MSHIDDLKTFDSVTLSKYVQNEKLATDFFFEHGILPHNQTCHKCYDRWILTAQKENGTARNVESILQWEEEVYFTILTFH